MMRLVWMCAAFLTSLPAWGCTVVCGNDVDVQNGFTVEARFHGKPLEGAIIELRDDVGVKTFATGPDGSAIVRLPEGKYSLTVRKFGAVIGSECGIRVSESSGRRSFTYEWKDTLQPVAKVSGRFSHQLYGAQGLTPLPSWKMVLHAIDGPVRQATVAPDGTFDFGDLPAGLYALEVPAAEGARPILLQLDSDAKRRDLDLILSGGMCGAAFVFFRDLLDTATSPL